MKRINKLVRDKIPEILKARGEIPIYKTLSDEEYQEALEVNLQEKVNRYLKNKKESDLADIVETVECIMKSQNKTLETFIRLKREKNFNEGGYDKKIFLEKTFRKEELKKKESKGEER